MRKRHLEQFLTKPRGRLQNTYASLTFSMPRDSAARLNKIALARGMNLQGLVEVAVEDWLARQPAYAKLDK